MHTRHRLLTRRALLWSATAALAAPLSSFAFASQPVPIRVYKDPSCGCCDGWIEHLRQNGFAATVGETTRMQAVKARLGVPDELASCHTAEVAGYVVEGHVPAGAIHRLLAEKPEATGLSAPGMPIGSPGMEGGAPEVYDVILFGKSTRRSFGRYRGAERV